jgi:RNA polymerase primary sigma factor
LVNHRGNKARHMPAFDTKTPGSSITGLKETDAAGLQRIGTLLAEADLELTAADLQGSNAPSADPVRKYLDEISAIPRLSADDEKALSEQIRKGLRARSRLEKNDLRGHEAEKLRKQKARGTLAGRLLFKANLRLVVYLARRYDGFGVSLPDLIQEGNIGLLRAVEKFDHRKETRFSTYAAWWIKQAIGRAVAQQARPVRLPEHTIQSINDINSIRRWLEAEEGREAGCRDIALEVGLLSAEDVEKIKKALAAKKSPDPSLEKRWHEAARRVSALTGLIRQPIPLGKPSNEEEGRSIEEELRDGANPDPVEILYRRQINSKLCEIMGALSEEECKVLQMRYGLSDRSEMTVDEVADELGLAPERVRQLETRALRSLRHPDLSSQLKDLLK